MPRETQPERARVDRDQTYHVSPATPLTAPERRVEMLSESMNRTLTDIGIRLTRIEERLAALEAK